MLWSALDRELGQIAGTADEPSSGRSVPGPEPEQGLKCRHRRLAPGMTKDEFVEIDLQVMPADTVIGADEPLLQVPNGAVRQRHHGRHASSQRTPGRLRAGDVPHACGRQFPKAFQAVGVDRGAWRDGALDELDHRRLFDIRNDGHPHTTRSVSPFFYRHQDEGGLSSFELPTPSQPRLRPADPGVIDLHLTLQGLPGRIDHGAPELVEHQPRGLVPAHGQLPLQQQRRDPALVCRHQIRRPKPQRQRGPRPVEDRARRQRHLVPALGAFTTLPLAERERPAVAAARTSKAVRPATGLQILTARRLVSELPLEMAEADRECRPGHRNTLLMVAS